MTSAMKYLMIIIIIFTQYQQYSVNRTCEKVYQLLYPSLKMRVDSLRTLHFRLGK